MILELMRAETWALFPPYSSFSPLAISNVRQPFMCQRFVCVCVCNLQPPSLFWASARTTQLSTCSSLWDAVSHKHLELNVSKNELSILPALSPLSAPPSVCLVSVYGPFTHAMPHAKKTGSFLAPSLLAELISNQ